jgi:hypothetical protein
MSRETLKLLHGAEAVTVLEPTSADALMRLSARPWVVSGLACRYALWRRPGDLLVGLLKLF